jgi:putative MATE family efflux protein
MDERLDLLEKEKVNKLIFKFSLPTIIGLLVTASYTIFDRIFVGKGVGSLALTGISFVFPLVVIIMAFAALIGIGATAMVSIKLGEKNQEEADAIAGNAFTLSIVTSLILTVFGYIFLDRLLIVFGAEGEVLKYAHDFTIILLPGTVFQILLFTLNNIIRGEGNPKIAMITMLISSIINIILNPIFIFILKMGVKGSALATVISQFISMIWVIAYFYGKKSIIKLYWRNFKIKAEYVKKIFSIGMASFAMQIAGCIITIILNTELKAYGGDMAVASFGIILSVQTLFLMPIFGINQGIQPILGYNFGAKKYNRLQEALKSSMIIATLVCIFGFIIIFFFSEFIISLFSKNDSDLISIGSHGLRIWTFLFPFIGFQIVSMSYFQAIGKAKQSLFFSMLRQVLALIPLLLILPKYFLLDGVWLAGPFSDGFASIVMIIFLIYEWKHLEKMKKASISGFPIV